MLAVLGLAVISNVTTVDGYRFASKRLGDEREKVTIGRTHGKPFASLTGIYGSQVFEYFKPRDLNRDGAREIMLRTWTGGAHASFAYVVLSLGRIPRVLLAFDKGNGEGDITDLQPKDLDGDGIAELVTWSDSFAYVLGAGYAPVPIPMIFAYRGGRYREATASFPAPVRAQAKTALGLIAKSEWPRTHAAEFLGCKIILGEEQNAWSVLRGVRPETYRSLWRHRTWLRRVVNSRFEAIGYPKLRGELRMPSRSNLEPKWEWDDL